MNFLGFGSVPQNESTQHFVCLSMTFSQNGWWCQAEIDIKYPDWLSLVTETKIIKMYKFCHISGSTMYLKTKDIILKYCNYKNYKYLEFFP